PVHFLHFLAAVFVLTVLLMLGISALGPASAPAEAAAAARVDTTPWRLARPVSALIVIGTLAFYIALAQ
ncbi:MAG: solute:sodium symporter family transporter, partial [Woeseiaceae bacterium]